jgi:hypothetical protein
MTGDGPLDLGIGYPRLLLYVLVVAVTVGVVVAASTSGAAFGAYNARWDGASELRETATAAGSEPTIVTNASHYDRVPAEGSVALVLSPDRPYDAADRERLGRFVENGGTLVVAEDVGRHGNPLLEAAGATARFDAALLRDERHNHRTSALPVARNVSEHALTTGVDRLTLNRGTVVEPGNATVLVRSSEFGFLDRNANGEIDGDESLASRPVATVERVGDGRVVAVSDPSLFINAMLERRDNRRFTRNLFGSGERVLLDYSHTADVPPLALALLVVRETAWLQAALGVAGLAAIALWSTGAARGALGLVGGGVAGRIAGRRGSRGEPWVEEPRTDAARTDDLVAHVRRRHPEWDEDRVERVVAAVREEEPGE